MRVLLIDNDTRAATPLLLPAPAPVALRPNTGGYTAVGVVDAWRELQPSPWAVTFMSSAPLQVCT